MTNPDNQKDLRREQLELIRFENLLEAECEKYATGARFNKAAVIAGAGAVSVAALSAAEKLGDGAPLQYAAELESAVMSQASGEAWFLNLAEVVTKGHAVIEALAQNGAFAFFQAGGGTPKKRSVEAVSSLLMSGPF